MTDWKAVGVGFVIALVFGAIGGLIIPGVAHIGAGFIGGFAAGYLAGGVWSGAWHGLLAGAIGGVALAIVFGVLVTVLGSLGLGPLGPIVGGSVFLLGVFLAVILALDSALAGAIGGLLTR